MRQVLGWLTRVVMRWVPVLLGLVLLIAGIAWMEGFFESKIAPGVAAAEERLAGDAPTSTVSLLKTVEKAEAVGTVQPRQKTEIAARLLAAIQEVRVEPGDRVEEGQLLITLDDREIQAQLREIEAARLGVESDLSVRDREFQRFKQMFAEKAVTQEDYDRVEGMLRVTQAQLKRTDAQVSRMRVMLSYAKIIAPRSGLIADRFADPGDLAAPGKPLLTLHDPDELELHASVRAGLAGDVKPEQKLSVQIDSLALHLDGTVREIVPQAQAASRSVLVKVSLPVKSADGLYIGMFGRLAIPLGETQRVVIAADAVQQIGQLEVADVIDNGRLKRRFVRTGRRFGDQVEILSGLNVGEVVAERRLGKE